MAVRDIDRGWDRMKAHLRYELRSAEVSVGVHSDEQGADGTTMALIAGVHEFGAPSRNIPARPFIRPTFDENRGRYERLMVRAARLAMAGTSLRVGLALVGQQVTADIQRRIRAGISPPLAPSTLARRGRRTAESGAANNVFTGPTPLIDTGRLINSIRYVVSVRGRES